MNDDDLARDLRERIAAAPLASNANASVIIARGRVRARRRRTTVAVGGALAITVTGALLTAGPLVPSARETAVLPVAGPPAAASTPSESPTPARTAEPAQVPAVQAPPGVDIDRLQPCEFEAQSAAPPGSGAVALEGWWNSSPINADGTPLDPAQWDPRVLAHPRTAQVDTSTGVVLESNDRYTCGPVEGYVPPPLDSLPADSLVILDADTGEILMEVLTADLQH